MTALWNNPVDPQTSCRMNEKASSESFEVAAKAHVEKLVTLGGSKGEGVAESKDCTLLHVVVDTRGCSPELSSLGSMNDFQSVAETLKTLAHSTKNAPGTPFNALLYHYRCACVPILKEEYLDTSHF